MQELSIEEILKKELKRILDLIGKQHKPIVYIDEIHNIVGAGALNGGALDASNFLNHI